MENKIKVFESKQVRTLWNAEEEEWYFSVVDIVAILTDSKEPNAYWRKLKQRLKDEGNETVTNCHALKMQVGSERLDEIADPEKAILRGAEFYRAKGYTEGWINQRLQTIEMRKELTDEWKARGVDSSRDYAILTNEMTRAWSGMSVQEYKQYKGLKKENLRDNMTNIELVLNMLAEVTATAISKQEQPKTFTQNKSVARRGGRVAKNAREDIESQLGQSVISPLNATDKPALEVKTIDEDDDK